ncbi:dTDP-glucose 4,6-dehydratase [Alkalicoccus daliensis]|uniref:dTDP-glucose 4,6-dehydratase n=1 Tax=Alkalicoccus daliensis TaxID=745820 RepID=A0A1G9ZP54_9BACI|nr:dTDP-glucose 4,6-dehydratase [Alkalicoccus daliensis]SDN22386.1 dTDP-glucose 4,6-dehydratase [Alkalicoccus daliensis]
MNVLVTGGAGFIGRHLVDMLEKEYLVVNVDKLTYAGDPEATASQKNFIKGDILDQKKMEEIIQHYHIDTIVHAAAESHVDRSIVHPLVFTDTNVKGTQVLLEAAKNCEVKTFVQVSTDEVYGSLGQKGLFYEDSPISPNSPYAASKASGDLITLAYGRTYGMKVMITRCSNNYGPYQFPEKLIPRLIGKALYDEHLPIYGDGLNIRDWLHVEDHCRAIKLVMEEGIDGEVYNIGCQSEKTNLEIAKSILMSLDKPQSLISYVSDRLGHDRRYAINADKIQRELGWQPLIDMESGLRSTIEWYKENKDWWEKKWYEGRRREAVK